MPPKKKKTVNTINIAPELLDYKNLSSEETKAIIRFLSRLPSTSLAFQTKRYLKELLKLSLDEIKLVDKKFLLCISECIYYAVFNLEEFKSNSKLDWIQILYRIELANYHFETEAYRYAADEYLAIIYLDEKVGNYPQAYFRRGLAHIECGSNPKTFSRTGSPQKEPPASKFFESAIFNLSKFLELGIYSSSECIQAHSARAFCYSALKQYDSAKKSQKKVIALEPNKPSHYYHYAILNMLMKNHTIALRYFELAKSNGVERDGQVDEHIRVSRRKSLELEALNQSSGNHASHFNNTNYSPGAEEIYELQPS